MSAVFLLICPRVLALSLLPSPRTCVSNNNVTDSIPYRGDFAYWDFCAHSAACLSARLRYLALWPMKPQYVQVPAKWLCPASRSCFILSGPNQSNIWSTSYYNRLIDQLCCQRCRDLRFIMSLFAAGQCGELIRPSHNTLIPRRWRSLSTRHVLNSVWRLSATWLADPTPGVTCLKSVHASNIMHCSHSHHQLPHWLKGKQVRAHSQVHISNLFYQRESETMDELFFSIEYHSQTSSEGSWLVRSFLFVSFLCQQPLHALGCLIIAFILLFVWSSINRISQSSLWNNVLVFILCRALKTQFLLYPTSLTHASCCW